MQPMAEWMVSILNWLLIAGGQLWFWINDENDDNRVVAGNLPDGGDWAANVRGFGSGQFF